jgi:tetratricopeptide (TPR) repeat protein
VKLLSGQRAIWLGAAALVVAGGLAYSNSLGGPFIFDDVASIPENASIRHVWPLSGPLHPPGFGATVDSRPVLNLTLALNFAISGLDVDSYHLVNLVIHLLAALTLYGIVRRTGLRLGADAASAAAFAFTVALIWELHPLDTESVTYVVQRAESLMGLFYLLTLYGFIRASAAEGPEAGGWKCASVLACLLGMGTKEVMVSAPVMVLALDALLISGSIRAAWRRRTGYYASLAVCWLPLALLVHHAGSRGGRSGFHALGVSAGQYWLTQPGAIAHYLRLVFWPEPLILDYGADWVTSVRAVIAPLILLALLGGATVFALVRSRRAGTPGAAAVAGFLGLWFWAVLAPTSVVPGNRQTVCEHRMYLALIPVLVATMGALVWAMRGPAVARRRVALVVGCALALPAGLLTFRRNHDYASEWSIFEHDARLAPRDASAQISFGDMLLRRRHRALESIDHYQAAIRLGLDPPTLEYNYALALDMLNRPEEAAEHFRTALRLKPPIDGPQDYTFLSLIYLGRTDEAIRSMVQLLRRYPETLATESLLAVTMVQVKDFRCALPLYQAMLEAYPAMPEIHADLGSALVSAGRPVEAIVHYREALRLRPGVADVHFNLAEALVAAGQTAEALAEFREALRLRPNFVAAHYNLGLALMRRGDLRAAVAEFEQSVRLAPRQSQPRCSLADALAETGRVDEAIEQFRTVLKFDPDSSYARAQLESLGAPPGRAAPSP